MTSRTTPLRHAVRAPVGVVLLILAVSLAGCVPADPAAAPTPSFSNEAEAFAAAEATYREYVKALNAVDLSDPETFEGVYAWTTGDLHSADRESLSAHHADGVQVEGDSVIALVEPETSTWPGSIRLLVCLDVKSFVLADEAGNSLVPSDRADVLAIRVNLSESESSPTGLLIDAIAPREGEPACES